MEATLKGRLLVATPALLDPNFFRSVVLLVEHDVDGAAGVVLNRPSEMDLASAPPLGSWRSVAAEPSLIFVGGPVQPTAAICLARMSKPPAEIGFKPVVDGLGVLDLDNDPDRIRTNLDRVRVFAGYAGWGGGQLEHEIEEGSWYVLDADPEDALSSEPVGLWRSVLKRQGGRLALVANFPADPNMN